MESQRECDYGGITVSNDVKYSTDDFLVSRCYREALDSVLIPEGIIRDRVKLLACDIHAAIGDQPIMVLCVLKGSYRFFTLLVEHLSEVRFDCKSPIIVEFIRAQSYTNTESAGFVEIGGLSNPEDLREKTVLLVEDIVDSGQTLSQLTKTLTQKVGVQRIWTAILVSKRVQRVVRVQEDFVAFNIPDKFIVGFGLDYNQYFRDLNHICVMNAAGVEKYKQKSKQTL